MAPLKYALSLLGLMSAKVVEATEMTRREIASALANLEDHCPDYVIAVTSGRKKKVGAVAS